MWYVMQVHIGKEEEVQKYCEITLPRELLQDCFCLTAEKSYKNKGERRLIKQPLFPGYLFLITENIEQVNLLLRRAFRFARVLKEEDAIVPLAKEEQEFIERCENEEHVFEFSRGYMTGDKVAILEGAMAGFYGKLKYVDRHNRYGVMEVEMFGRKTDVTFGLELLKSEEEWKMLKGTRGYGNDRGDKTA